MTGPDVSPAPTIRLARADEVDAVAALYHEVWHATQAHLMPPEVAAARDLAFFRRRVAGYADPVLVAAVSGALAGFAARKGAYLEALFVRARGRGAGAALLAASEAAMRAAGEAEATLLCMVGNDGARRFYERHGWALTGEVELPVEGPAAPLTARAWRMVKPLGG